MRVFPLLAVQLKMPRPHPSATESLPFLAEIPPRAGKILSAAELRAHPEEITAADAMHHVAEATHVWDRDDLRSPCAANRDH